MTAKKAVDLIYDINDKIDTMMSKLSSMEEAMSSVNNKIYVLNEKVSSLESKILEVKNSSVNHPTAVAHVISSPAPSASPKKSEKLLIGNVKIYGYVYNKNKSPISGVDVTLFTSDNEIVRSLKTDGSGYWEARVRSGRYSVELKHGRFKPINKFVEIPEGVSDFEVK